MNFRSKNKSVIINLEENIREKLSDVTLSKATFIGNKSTIRERKEITFNQNFKIIRSSKTLKRKKNLLCYEDPVTRLRKELSKLRNKD